MTHRSELEHFIDLSHDFKKGYDSLQGSPAWPEVLDLIWVGNAHRYGPSRSWAHAWTEVMAIASQTISEDE